MLKFQKTVTEARLRENPMKTVIINIEDSYNLVYTGKKFMARDLT